ncbi:type II toxin-antitoxin system VapC family toxin [Pantanalinema rosaneae CENA516]|uniref:type II toxin-antitoxin system VapC family toxin n=1 Tax=Pantanalinema rosaneae TaxID=1620701 RepID=UPI003D6E8925
MKQLFADTFYWIASINPGDDWHKQAIALTATLDQVQIVTTDEVLTEVLTFFAGRGMKMRQRAVQLVKGIMNNPKILVLQQTRESFLAGVQFYESRPDKKYSLPDCISMNTMRQLNVRDVLTHDKHFIQEGYVILLGDKSGY